MPNFRLLTVLAPMIAAFLAIGSTAEATVIKNLLCRLALLVPKAAAPVVSDAGATTTLPAAFIAKLKEDERLAESNSIG